MRRFQSAVLVLTLILFSSGSLNAQNRGEFNGQLGKLYLKNDRIVEGEISYDLEKDWVQIRENSRLYTLQANQITRFVIYLRNNRTRYFESLPIKLKNGYVRNQLFELVYKGEASLYTRLKIEDRSLIFNHDFYLKMPKAEYLVDLAERNYKRFQGAFAPYQQEITKFRKEQDIDIKEPFDVAKVVAYYNSLLDEADKNSQQ